MAMRTATSFLAVAFLSMAPGARAQMAVEYYHLDAVGTVLAVTNQAGALVEEHDYDVFGQEVGAQAGTQPKRFAGKERDGETGWDYFGARYYGSKTGRFTTVDPVYTWKENLVDPQRWNRYAYARNNPLRYSDPDGRAPKPVRGAAERLLFQQARREGVRRAWAAERETLIKYGPEKMSMQLTKAEQKELLERGAVTGWEGHHINNVAANDLAMARDPGNIKFVKGRGTHLEEHGGNFHIPTSGSLIERATGLLVGLIPGMGWLEAGEVAVEVAGAGADRLGESVREGSVGQHVRQRDEALRAASGQE